MVSLAEALARELNIVITVLTSLISLVILTYVIWDMHRNGSGLKSKYFEDKLFVLLCIMNLILIGYGILILFYNDVKDNSYLSRFMLYSPDIIYLLYALIWMLFLDYYVNRDMERIKGHVITAVGPFILLIFFEIVIITVEYNMSRGRMNWAFQDTFDYQWLVIPYLIIEAVLTLSYIIGGFVIIRDHHRKRMEPVFLRLDFFVVPWLLGVIIGETFFSGALGLFASVSILITYIPLKMRKKYLDDESRAYTEEALDFILKYIEREKIQEGCAFIVKAPMHKDQLYNIIKLNIPEGALVIHMNNGDFLIFTNIRSKLAIEVFERTIQDAGINYDPPTSIHVMNFRRLAHESMNDFVDRVLKDERENI